MNHDTVVINGEIRLDNNIDGEQEMESNIQGDIGIFLPIFPNTYTGELDITPKAYEEQILECAFKTMPDNVTVRRVPYFETHNETGMTAYIAAEG